MPNGEIPAEAPVVPPEALTYGLTLTLDQLKFLGVLLHNATLQPAEFKLRCGEIQGMVEAILLPIIQAEQQAQAG